MMQKAGGKTISPPRSKGIGDGMASAFPALETNTYVVARAQWHIPAFGARSAAAGDVFSQWLAFRAAPWWAVCNGGDGCC